MKLNALIAKTTPAPVVSISTPANAGPTSTGKTNERLGKRHCALKRISRNQCRYQALPDAVVDSDGEARKKVDDE